LAAKGACGVTTQEVCGALSGYGEEMILRCLGYLRGQAEIRKNLDCLQVFESEDESEPLWFIEDAAGGAITALLPGDY